MYEIRCSSLRTDCPTQLDQMLEVDINVQLICCTEEKTNVKFAQDSEQREEEEQRQAGVADLERLVCLRLYNSGTPPTAGCSQSVHI